VTSPGNATAPRHPSGDQYAISAGGWTADVTQVGGTLRRLVVDGDEVLDGFEVDERATDGRGQVLAPWPNRITDGSYTYGGVACQAPLNEPERHDAIHGLVRWLEWSVVTHASDSVALSCTLHPQPGYEWELDLQVRYTLAPSGLTVALDVVNTGSSTAPFGAGFHPYLAAGGSVDSHELTVPALRYLQAAAGPEEAPSWQPVDGTAADFRQPRRIADTRLDTAYGDLVRGSDGLARAALTDPGRGHTVELWVDASFGFLMVYTADSVGRPERRRRAVAIEPMTCPPDAFRTDDDVIALEPGEPWTGRWGLGLVTR
jgi:aldose 1-epimerase